MRRVPVRAPSFALAAALALLAAAAAGAARAEEPAPAAETPAARSVEQVVADLRSDEEAVRLAAAEEAAAVTDDAVASPLVKLLRDDRFDVRKAAIAALAKRSTEKGRKAAAAGLVARLGPLSKSAELEGELVLVVRALHDLAQESAIPALLDDIGPETGDEVVRARLLAVANVPSKKAVDELIQFLSRQGRGKWQGARRHVADALRYATGENLGGDPDVWRAWWRDAERTFDVEAAAKRRAEEGEARGNRRGEREGREGRRER